MDKSWLLRFALLVEVILLLANAAAISKDYQDGWVLEGLEIPFAVFTLTYMIYVFTESKIRWIIPFALIFRSVFFVIPNLKYPWFQGIAIDQHEHYGLMQDIYNQGYIRSAASFESIFFYSGTPLMHLIMVIYSKITLISPLNTFKYIPFIFWLIYPVIIFLIMKRLTRSSMEKDHSPIKYAVIIASIPFRATTSYVVVGTTFGLLLTFLFLSQFIKVLQTNDRRDWLIAIIFSIALVVTHSYSSITLMIGLLITYVAYKIFLNSRSAFHWHALNVNLLIFLVVINGAQLLFRARKLFDQAMNIIISFVNSMIGEAGVSSAGAGIYPRFFELNFIDMFRIIVLYYGADLFLLLLVSLGIIVAIRKFRSSKPLMILFFYVISLWSYTVIQMVLGRGSAGLLEYIRLPVHTLVLCPIFCAVLLYHVKTTRRTKLFVSIVILLTILATVELYNPPQLVPASSTISKDLPSSEPLVYVNGVNSAYQRYLIKHAENFIGIGLIACDRVTQNQHWGLVDYTFIADHLLRYYPFTRLLNLNTTDKQYDYFLIHSPGKSGSFQEKAEIRTASLILEAVYNSSIVYTNGESYMLTKPFMYSP